MGKEAEREYGQPQGALGPLAQSFRMLSEKPQKVLAPQIGIMPTPAEFNKTEAERLMTQMGAEQRPSGAMTKAQREHFDLKREIRTAFMTGNRTEAEARMQGAIQQGKLTRRDVNDLRKSAGETPMGHNFKRLNADDALRVWELMTPQEKTVNRQEMMVKMRSIITNASPEKRGKLLPRFKEVLGV